MTVRLSAVCQSCQCQLSMVMRACGHVQAASLPWRGYRKGMLASQAHIDDLLLRQRFDQRRGGAVCCDTLELIATPQLTTAATAEKPKLFFLVHSSRVPTTAAQQLDALATQFFNKPW